MHRHLLPLLALTLPLAACAPAALRAQPGSATQVQTRFSVPEVRRADGQTGYYRRPGPPGLLVTANADANVYALLLPPQGEAVLLTPDGGEAALPSGQAKVFTLPPTSGFNQLFTVVSRAPLNLNTASFAGVRDLKTAGEVVARATASLPAGSWNVATDVFRSADFGSLEIASAPAGASVSLDGKAVGVTPLLGEVEAGQLRVGVSEDGYIPWARTVTVTAGTVASPTLAKICWRRVLNAMIRLRPMPAASKLPCLPRSPTA